MIVQNGELTILTSSYREVLAVENLDERRTQESHLQHLGIVGELEVRVLPKELLLPARVGLPDAGLLVVLLQRTKVVPPGLALPIEHAAPLDGDVLGFVGVDERREADHLGAFPARADHRQVVVEVGAELQHCARVDEERDVALQANRTGKVLAGRKEDGAAAGQNSRIDCPANGIGALGFAIGDGPVVTHVEVRRNATFGAARGLATGKNDHQQAGRERSIGSLTLRAGEEERAQALGLVGYDVDARVVIVRAVAIGTAAEPGGLADALEVDPTLGVDVHELIEDPLVSARRDRLVACARSSQPFLTPLYSA